MRKNGSILIEVLASIIILTLATTFIISASIQNSEKLKERILLESINRDIFNLANELKYNTKNDEIEKMLNDNSIGFKYDEEFSKRLIDREVKDLERGEDIIVSKIKEDNIGLKFEINTNITKEKIVINIKNEFTKSWWMDEL